MARWTSELSELKKLAGLADFLGEWGTKPARVVLTSGQTVEGVILPARAGNNAGAGGRWMYYGTIAIRTDDEDVEIDYLDVVTVLPLRT